MRPFNFIIIVVNFYKKEVLSTVEVVPVVVVVPPVPTKYGSTIPLASPGHALPA